MIQASLTGSSNELSKVSTTLLSDLREGVFFGRLSGFILSALEEDQVEIYLVYNDETSQLIARNGKEISSSRVLARGEGASGYVTKTQRIYYSNSVGRDPIFSNDERDERINSEMIVPVVVEGKVIATVHVQSFDDERKFSEADAVAVKSFLNDQSVALGNMNLYLMAKFLNRELLGKIKEKTSQASLGDSTFEIGNSNLEIIGQNTELLKALSLAKRVATQDIPVLIEGEAGVGKRLLSKRIHSMSLRKGMPCQVIECGTLNEENLEKEIFGFEEKGGFLEAVNNGTLILNDISALSFRLQSKLLEFMMTGKAMRVGGNEVLSLNVRLIAVSQASLKSLVSEKKFRDDLFYRLATVQISVPSLKERGDDIKILANHFLNLNKKDKKFLTAKALEELNKYSWEGNILELRNAMERTYALSDGKYIDSIEMGGFGVAEEKQEEGSKEIEAEAFEPLALQEIEKRHICRTLEHLSGNKTRAAKSLGITVKTLYNKLHSYGLISKTN